MRPISRNFLLRLLVGLGSLACLEFGIPPVLAEVTEADFFPFYFSRVIQDASGITYDEDWGWPFGRFEQGYKTWNGALRPFFSWGGDFADAGFLRVIPPLGKFDWSDDEVDNRIQPFWYSRWDVNRAGEEHQRTLLFPFINYDSERSDPATSFSFLYGHLYNRYGVDEAEYWFLPLYLRTHRGNFVNHNVLVPFLAYGSGGNGSNLRFWPFYGHKVIPGKSDSLFVLWPFYGHQMAYDEDQDIVESWGCFPLYYTIQSPRRNGWAVLWPFFETQTIDRPRRKYEKRSRPFPFNQRITDLKTDAQGNRVGGEDTRIYFPFYGHIQKDSRTRRLDAEYWSPLVWRIDRDRTDKFTSSQRILFPFIWSKTTTWASTGLASRDFKLWPLFNYEGTEDGGHQFRLFDPFWFRRGKDMDRHYSVLYTLYDRVRDGEGNGYDHFLGKSIYHFQHEDYSRTNLLHLLQLYDTPEEGRGWSVARGLFGRSVTDAGTRWRLFWFRLGE